MRKTISMMLTTLLILGMSACAMPAAPQTIPPDAPQSTSATSAFVPFVDPELATLIRASMGKVGDISLVEAESVTRLNLSAEWRRYISVETPVQDISGLEYFKNLESLDLSFHDITDVTPLAGLTKLSSLSLSGNPVADLSPLAGLTNLKVLLLSKCAAKDYTPLSKLVNLDFLMLDQSNITDVTPLVTLENLKHLFLAGCSIDSYFPLLNIYQGLEQKDFSIATTLAELGFLMDNDGKQAIYDGGIASVRINHVEWGAPSADWMQNSVRTVFAQNDYKIDIGYNPNSGTYAIVASGTPAINYLYSRDENSFTFVTGDRETSEQAVRAALGEAGDKDVLLTPINIFNEIIKTSFGMTADALFALPFEPTTLVNVGFIPDTSEAVYAYQEHEPHHMHITIYRPEWGNRPEKSNPEGCNIEFYDHDFNGFSLLILYFKDTGRYAISLYKDGTEAAYEIYPATNEYGTEYPDSETVNQMFNDAFGTLDKGFIYKPLEFFEQAIANRFHMSIDELYALPIE
jgi:hypothetical protein